MAKIHKRHILLLEVLIAIAIIVMCIVPMLQPHLYMLQEEKSFIREVELDRVVGVVYTNLLVDRFYRPNITWDEILSGYTHPIDSPDLTRLGYTGSYSFKLDKKKGKMAEDEFALDLLKVTLAFQPKGGKPISYSYDLFVQRIPKAEDITQTPDEPAGQPPQQQTQQQTPETPDAEQ